MMAISLQCHRFYVRMLSDLDFFRTEAGDTALQNFVELIRMDIMSLPVDHILEVSSGKAHKRFFVAIPCYYYTHILRLLK